LFVFGAAARGVDILDAQQEPASIRLRRAMRRQRREGVPHVQKSRWTWREAGDNHGLSDLIQRKVALCPSTVRASSRRGSRQRILSCCATAMAPTATT